MIGYTPSHLTENEVILEKLNQIIDYLIKNPSYQVYAYNGGFISGTLTYEIANIINSNNINVADVVVFNNGYYGIISEITETEFTLSQGISLIGPQGPQGPKGPKGDTGTIPEALPQEASALKSGELPTSGWVAEIANIVTTTTQLSYGNSTTIAQIDTDIAKLKTGWEITLTGDNQEYSGTYYSQYESGQNRIVYKYPSEGKELYDLTDKYGNVRFYLGIGNNGEISMNAADRNAEGTYTIGIKNTTYSQWVLSISDTSITANSDILMELTDEGGVKSYSMEAGKMTVIRDTVPTQPIPYTYKVKQTNASGQFTLVNHFVPEVPESPTSLPVTYKKVSGSLPTTGWSEIIVQNLLTKNISVIQGSVLTETNKVYSQTIDAKYYGVLQGWKIKLLEDNKVYDAVTAMVTVGNEQYMEISYKAVTGFKFNIYLDKQGNIFYADHGSGGSTYTFSGLSNSTVALHTYSISDTSITANTSVKMYLTDAGGVKAYSKAVGSIQVIRDSVPTTAIPYEYEVEQTSAEGLFEVINAYVPTKTSDLQNDSGFITAADIPSAGEWQNWSDTSVLTEEGLYEIVTTEYPSDGNKTLFVRYEQGKPNNGACWVSVATANSISVVTPICSGDGTLHVERRLANSSGPADLLTFKYRKILN